VEYTKIDKMKLESKKSRRPPRPPFLFPKIHWKEAGIPGAPLLAGVARSGDFDFQICGRPKTRRRLASLGWKIPDFT
jgi:hypothetical protein